MIEHVIPIRQDLSEKNGDNDTGFPFDDTDDFDEFNTNERTSLNKHLEDIASRFPEFSESLRGWDTSERFPSFRRARRFERDTPNESPDTINKSDTPNKSKDTSNVTSNVTPSQSDTPNESDTPEANNNAAEKLSNYGLRNTIDLAAKTPVDDALKREQRSMSAPPDNRVPNQSRFVSRVNIEPQASAQATVQPPQQHTAPQPTPPTEMGANQSAKKSHVRHIPIFVEGRDQPVIPRDEPDAREIPVRADEPFDTFGKFNRPSFYQQPFNRARQFDAAFPAQRGRSPDPHSYGQFAGPVPQVHKPTQPGMFPSQQKTGQEHPGVFQQASQNPGMFQQAQPNPGVFQQAQPGPGMFQQSHRSGQQPGVFQQSQQPSATAPPSAAAPPKPSVPMDAISKIEQIAADVAELAAKIDKFEGSRKDKEYIYLDEMLTRNLIKLDVIETDGKENIRQARKNAIKSIQKCISVLEEKASQSEPSNQCTNTMDVDETSQKDVEESHAENEGESQVESHVENEAESEEVEKEMEVDDKSSGLQRSGTLKKIADVEMEESVDESVEKNVENVEEEVAPTKKVKLPPTKTEET